MTKGQWRFRIALHVLLIGSITYGLYLAFSGESSPFWLLLWGPMVAFEAWRIQVEIGLYQQQKKIAAATDATLAAVADSVKRVKDMKWDEQHNAETCVICQRLDKEE